MSSEDKIRKQFQSRFSDFEVPVPAEGWARLEESLIQASAARRMVVRRRWQYASSAAVILALVVGGLFYLNRPAVDEEPYMSDVTISAITTTDEVEAKVEVEPQIDTRVSESPLIAGRNFTSVVSIQSPDPILIMSDYIEQKVPRSIEDMFVINPVLPEFGEKQSYTLNEEHLIFKDDRDLLYADNDVNNDVIEYILSFGGKGGFTAFHQTVNSPMALRSAAVSSELQLSGELDKTQFQSNNLRDNIAEMEHDQPISFGLTVSKSITDNLYIETGLIYSYLHSKSKNRSLVSQNQQTLSLHYLGVPLNLNYNLFCLRDLKIYVSLGGMIEKDVYGKFREEGESQSLDAQNNSVVLINENISQKNPQLSVNTGLGVSYPIYRDLKLYGKIGGAYYFDAKNDYKTIYSDRKIVMDLNMGIRYEF